MTGKDFAVGSVKLSVAMAVAVLITFGLQAWGVEVPTGITEALAVVIGFLVREVRRRNGTGRAAAVGLVLLLVAGPVTALEIQWDPPTERVDGSALDPATEIAAYNFMCGVDAGGPFDQVDYRIPGTETDGVYEVAGDTVFPEYGDYQCVLTAEDQYGQESMHSEVVAVEYLPPEPGQPTNVIVFD